jgi:hypothetical protein
MVDNFRLPGALIAQGRQGDAVDRNVAALFLKWDGA